MSAELLIKLVVKKTITKQDIENELYETCEQVHADCTEYCPIYLLNGGEVPDYKDTPEGCDVFKDGKAMYKFIKAHYHKPIKEPFKP